MILVINFLNDIKLSKNNNYQELLEILKILNDSNLTSMSFLKYMHILDLEDKKLLSSNKFFNYKINVTHSLIVFLLFFYQIKFKDFNSVYINNKYNWTYTGNESIRVKIATYFNEKKYGLEETVKIFDVLKKNEEKFYFSQPIIKDNQEYILLSNVNNIQSEKQKEFLKELSLTSDLKLDRIKNFTFINLLQIMFTFYLSSKFIIAEYFNPENAIKLWSI